MINQVPGFCTYLWNVAEVWMSNNRNIFQTADCSSNCDGYGLHDLYVESHHHTYIHTTAIVSSFLSLSKPMFGQYSSYQISPAGLWPITLVYRLLQQKKTSNNHNAIK